MTTNVKLYVYDLSNGLARSLSVQFTGRQIDGIWHTSVVVFGREIFYGQGILTTRPGRSHHGQPLQVVDMGETAIDEETFNEYLHEMREYYTADKYHLLDFNCNSFTNDVVGFLTGGSIPDFIKDLPSDFLSTPFGAALRPTIDAMFRAPNQASDVSPPSITSQNPQLTASILQSAAAQAQGQQVRQTTTQAVDIASITAPMHAITNSASFNSFLTTHRAAAALFTSQTCPPCRMIEPVFEKLAEEKGPHNGRQGVAFAQVDINAARSLAAEWNIRATPTFYFFLDGKKKGELKGADAAELRAQINLLIYEAYPPHPHIRLNLPHVQKISLKPILFTQVPAVDTVTSKLFSSIDEVTWPSTINPTPDQIRSIISTSFAPYLKGRFTPSNSSSNSGSLVSSTPTMLNAWSQATVALISVLPTEVLFPLIDMWRLAFLDPATSIWATSPSTSPCGGPLSVFLPKAIESLQSEPSKGSRNYILTVIRLLCNSFSNSVSVRKLLTNGLFKTDLTAVLVQSLLYEDGLVRTAAASLAFNIGAWLQSNRTEAVRNGRGIQANTDGEDEDWEVELITAILEALEREKANEEVVHRLVASLALYVRLSPFNENLDPLLEVLQVQDALKGKLTKGDGWSGDGGINKKEIRQLVEEVAKKLCV